MTRPVFSLLSVRWRFPSPLAAMAATVDQRIGHHDPRSRKHDGKADEIGRRRHLAQQEEGEQRANEGRDRIVGACLDRADYPLRLDVKENAQSIRHKARKEGREDVFPACKALPIQSAMINAPRPEKIPLRKTM